MKIHKLLAWLILSLSAWSVAYGDPDSDDKCDGDAGGVYRCSDSFRTAGPRN